MRNLAFRLPAKVDYEALPWVTFTDPELAHVGLTEAQARERHGNKVSVPVGCSESNDRAVAEHRTTGSIKLVNGSRGRILGASISAPAAGEMIGLLVPGHQARTHAEGDHRSDVALPTMGEIGKAAAKPALPADLVRRQNPTVGRSAAMAAAMTAADRISIGDVAAGCLPRKFADRMCRGPARG